MVESRRKVGDAHPYFWPKICSFLTFNALEQMTKNLKRNNIWTICEKIDGCNVCVSTDGWLASRNKIIGRVENPMLPEQKFQQAPLDHVVPLHQKATSLRNMLADAFFPDYSGFELLVYGELVVPGSASSSEDIYKYKNRNLTPGMIFAFALGLVLPENVTLPFIFKHGFKANGNGKKSFFVIPMNNHLSDLLSHLSINHLSPIKTDYLAKLINNKTFQKDLFSRKREGFVLSSNEGEGYIKWKYSKGRTDIKDQQIEQLTKNLEKSHIMYKDAEYAVGHIENLYLDCDNFENLLSNIKYKLYIKTFLSDRSYEWKLWFTEAAKAGPFFLNLAFNEASQIMYSKIKETQYKKLDPRVKIQLKEKIRKGIVEWANYYVDYKNKNVQNHF